jgi:ribosome modulation factor
MAQQTDLRYYLEGFEAFEYGLSYTRCPYGDDTQQQMNWLKGWAAADKRSIEAPLGDLPPVQLDQEQRCFG